MDKLDQFLFELTSDIEQVLRNKIEEKQPISFVSFLGSLTDEKLNKYFEVAAKLLDQETEPTIEEIDMGIAFYSSIITEIEYLAIDKPVSIDEEGLWAFSLFSFLTMERFYRKGLLENFSGFLFEGKPYFKPTKKMFDIKDDVYNNLTAEQRKKFNI